MNRFEAGRRRVKEIHAALEAQQPISDDEIAAGLNEFAVMTNTLEAARQLMWAVAPVCSYRNQFLEQSLHRVLRPLWMTSFRTEHFLKWLEYHLEQEYPFDLQEAHAIAWLKTLPIHRDLIGRLFLEIEDEEHNAETWQLQQELTPRSHIPLVQIKFRFYWSSDMLTGKDAAIVLIYFSDDSSTEAFTRLTQVFSTYAEVGKIQFFVVHGECDELRKYARYLPDLADKAQARIQVLWFFRQIPIHHTRADNTAAEVYRAYTLDLLKRLEG